ncbi:hypothetical protein EUA94_17710 [Nocardioides zhouii]|uniref:GTPase-associated protein 1 N-terminal domain-containing protein n=1 Tax=Nocardioides zhouii TaxID=1168729 RepID=A0A4V1RNG1_9ACTN|nr:hypothetical protein EUA94_17710 [Nocardioides zhouii]
MLEQLHYTWAHRGLAGLSGFQPVAASEGIQRSPSMWAFALGLCRFDASANNAPLASRSLGWLTLPRYRCVFVRTPSGRDGYGRPGNFAAHVLVGPRDELTTGAALAFLNHGSMWTGMNPEDEVPPLLPPFELMDTPSQGQSPETPEPAMSPAMARAVMSGLRSVLDEPPPRLLSGLYLLEHRFPGILDDMSVSTYERLPSVTHLVLADRPFLSYFDIIGSGGAVTRADARAQGFEFVDDGWRGDLGVEQTTAAMLSSSAVTTRRLEKSWSGIPRGQHRFGLFRRTARVLALAEAGDRAATSDLRGLLGEAGLVQELVDDSQLRALVARSFIVGDPEVELPLAGVFSALSQDTQIALAEDMARACSRLSPQDLGAATQRAAHLGAGGARLFAAACLQEAPRFATGADKWPRSLVLLALSTLPPDGAWPAGFEERSAAFMSDIARSTAISDATFVRLWHRRMRLGGDGLLQALVASPGRLPGVVRQLGSASTVSVLEPVTDPTTVMDLLITSQVDLGDDITNWASHALADQRPHQRLTELLRLQPQVTSTHRAWSDLALDVFEDVVTEELNDPSRRLLADGRLLELEKGLGFSDADGWRHLLHTLTSEVARMTAMSEAPLEVREDVRAIAATYAIDLVLNRRRPSAGEAYLLDQLDNRGGLTETEGARALLQAGLRGCIAYQRVTPAATAIRNIYHRVALERLPVRRTWNNGTVLSDNELQRRASDIVARSLTMLSGSAKLRGRRAADLFVADCHRIRFHDSDPAQRWFHAFF